MLIVCMGAKRLFIVFRKASLVAELHGHTDTIVGLVSMCDTSLLSYAADGTVCLWKVWRIRRDKSQWSRWLNCAEQDTKVEQVRRIATIRQALLEMLPGKPNDSHSPLPTRPLRGSGIDLEGEHSADTTEGHHHAHFHEAHESPSSIPSSPYLDPLQSPSKYTARSNESFMLPSSRKARLNSAGGLSLPPGASHRARTLPLNLSSLSALKGVDRSNSGSGSSSAGDSVRIPGYILMSAKYLMSAKQVKSFTVELYDRSYIMYYC